MRMAYALVVAGVLGAIATANDVAADNETTVRVQEGQSLRDIAQQQLGDPDLWTEILRANGLRSPADVQPGMELKVPAAEIAAADRALRQALAAIQTRHRAGRAPVCRVPDRAWHRPLRGCRRQSEGGRLGGRDQGGGRGPDCRWRGAAARCPEPRHGRRGAADRSRGLGRGPHSPGSGLVGTAARRRPGGGGEASHVVALVGADHLPRRQPLAPQRQLAGGDPAHAYRSAQPDRGGQGQPGRGRFLRAAQRQDRSARSSSCRSPRSRPMLNSRNFWVRRDESGSKFTNYDEGVLKVAANGSEVELGRNEATLVRAGRQPTDKVGILAAVRLDAPADDAQTVTEDVALRWGPVADAVGYWLELAYDPGFQRMKISRWGLKETSFGTGDLEIGTYYWRIAALDKFGLPGERGEVWRFNVRVDQSPPFLTITEPAEEAVLTRSPFVVRGQTEPDARLRLNEAPVPVDAEGRFADRPHGAAGRWRAVIRGDRPGGQCSEAPARLSIRPGRSGRAALRRRHPAGGAPALRYPRQRHLAQWHHSPRRQAPASGGRPATARGSLRRRRWALRAECSGQREQHRIPHRRGTALRVREPGPVHGQRRSRAAEGSASSSLRRRSPQWNGCRCAAVPRAPRA